MTAWTEEKIETVEELIPVLIGWALCQTMMEFMIKEHPVDLEWLESYLQQSAFKLNWKWMIK